MRQVRKSPRPRSKPIFWIDEVADWVQVDPLVELTYDWLARPFVAPPIHGPVIDVDREPELVKIHPRKTGRSKVSTTIGPEGTKYPVKIAGIPVGEATILASGDMSVQLDLDNPIVKKNIRSATYGLSISEEK